ncbi:hypothetical protein BDK51DRAFT_23151 [Blyttiomyces helicus]|uniref:Phospholipid-transporting ATPase n=1 Tax=Blyttiomyces helicus TaxID=388810 RepID=A0A4P9WC21_9FUNG|nr:hypothetical protein BDK51DRAFT_23151 [Blyttiomyces helicus]|eukprot:RKO89133.1 hypothetical protein BDK51DRAFT_23151 [Blyttiomyces helicus]
MKDVDKLTSRKLCPYPPLLCNSSQTQKVSQMHGRLRCEHPNENLNSFEGRLHVDNFVPAPGAAPKELILPLTMSNLLLRGAVLRNTEFCYALVIYTGGNTKIIKNLKRAAGKSSSLERRLNWLVCGAFVYNAILLVSSGTNSSFPGDYAVEWYLGPADSSKGTHVFDTFISFFALYTYVIPISLFVTIEMVRLVQGKYMMWDKGMRTIRTNPDGTTTKYKMRANNTNLNEELGAVEYIFSDKTGTLTQNDMRLAHWYVDGYTMDEMIDPGALMRRIKDVSTPLHVAQKMIMFGRALSLCHSVIPATDEKTQKLVYESQSPDESALLYAIADDGFRLLTRTKSEITVAIDDTTESFRQLSALEFTSDRKRMSIIVRTPTGIHLYCKGADNIILQRLSPDPALNPPELISGTETALQRFSEQGLRTLVIAWCPLTEEQFERFHAEYEAAERTLNQREKRIAAACEGVERELRLLGCSAIEDRLQDQVPETIDYLLKCGIKIWLLTGDKMETAINIGNSSQLISPDMHVIILSTRSEEQCANLIESVIHEMNSRQDGRRNALVVDGQTLTYVLDSHADRFLEIGTRCHSVICCRVTPLQKALVVKLVQKTLKVVTLAIGDGANDVSMIQAANVGVGIMGREGTQAVRAADYAFPEFRFLRRLVTVHGRFSYMRLSVLIFYSFYKNITFITVQWWFGFFNAWSGQTVYEEIFLTAFNVVYTSIPPFVLAIFERDLDEDRIAMYPQLYAEARSGVLYWSPSIMATTLLSSFWHSFAIFFSVYFVNREGVLDVNGRSTGYWVQTYLFSTPLLITVLGKAALVTRRWVWPSWAGILVSLVLNLATMFLVEAFKYVDTGTSEIDHVLPGYYLLSYLMPIVCLLPDFFFM